MASKFRYQAKYRSKEMKERIEAVVHKVINANLEALDRLATERIEVPKELNDPSGRFAGKDWLKTRTQWIAATKTQVQEMTDRLRLVETGWGILLDDEPEPDKEAEANAALEKGRALLDAINAADDEDEDE
jgi:hypothetical protein